MSWELPNKRRDEDEEEPQEPSGDREPRWPKNPDKHGGAELEIPKEEKELICA